jgi:oxygen-dependent protoporphyrinogen oxidase
MRIAVIGGGISGLAAAFRITELLPQAELTLFEASDRLGGVLETVRGDGYLIERSADSFTTKLLWAADLCRRLGLAEQLLPTDESKRRALVVRDGKLLPVPAGFVLMSPGRMWPVLTTPVLSWRGKLRLLAERFVPRRNVGNENPADESVASFATRRVGRETYERLVQPLLAGIYTADPEKLSMAATLPELLAYERQGGSLWRRPLATRESGARYGLFVAPRDGMGSFVQAIAKRLPTDSVKLNTRVEGVRRAESGWLVNIAGDTRPHPFDGVVVALPAYAAEELLGGCDRELADELAGIEYAGCAVVSIVYRREQLAKPLEGFGFVVPQVESRPIIAASYASEKFPVRAPEGDVLIRVFLGGAMRPELLDQPDESLSSLAHEQLAELLGISGSPLRIDVARWPRSMPQYHVGHVDRVRRIMSCVEALPGLELAGNAYSGVGIPQCIRSGELAADRIAGLLAPKK